MAITTLNKEDFRKLQTLQNMVMRLQTGLARGTKTEYLLQQSGQLSVHQLGSYFLMLQVHKTKLSKQPNYLYNRIFPGGNIEEEEARFMRSLTQEQINFNCELSLSRSSFIYRASKLYNALPMTIKNDKSIPTFKANVKKWIKENINIRP